MESSKYQQTKRNLIHRGILMSAREITGLIVLAVAVTIFPFGYWIHHGWYIAAFVMACIGALFFFSKRVSKNVSDVQAVPDHLNPPYTPSHLRGFPGSKITRLPDHDLDFVDIDGDGE